MPPARPLVRSENPGAANQRDKARQAASRSLPAARPHKGLCSPVSARLAPRSTNSHANLDDDGKQMQIEPGHGTNGSGDNDDEREDPYSDHEPPIDGEYQRPPIVAPKTARRPATGDSNQNASTPTGRNQQTTRPGKTNTTLQQAQRKLPAPRPTRAHPTQKSLQAPSGRGAEPSASLPQQRPTGTKTAPPKDNELTPCPARKRARPSPPPPPAGAKELARGVQHDHDDHSEHEPIVPPSPPRKRARPQRETTQPVQTEMQEGFEYALGDYDECASPLRDLPPDEDDDLYFSGAQERRRELPLPKERMNKDGVARHPVRHGSPKSTTGTQDDELGVQRVESKVATGPVPGKAAAPRRQPKARTPKTPTTKARAKKDPAQIFSTQQLDLSLMKRKGLVFWIDVSLLICGIKSSCLSNKSFCMRAETGTDPDLECVRTILKFYHPSGDNQIAFTDFVVSNRCLDIEDWVDHVFFVSVSVLNVLETSFKDSLKVQLEFPAKIVGTYINQEGRGYEFDKLKICGLDVLGNPQKLEFTLLTNDDMYDTAKSYGDLSVEMLCDYKLLDRFFMQQVRLCNSCSTEAEKSDAADFGHNLEMMFQFIVDEGEGGGGQVEMVSIDCKKLEVSMQTIAFDRTREVRAHNDMIQDVICNMIGFSFKMRIKAQMLNLMLKCLKPLRDLSTVSLNCVFDSDDNPMGFCIRVEKYTTDYQQLAYSFDALVCCSLLEEEIEDPDYREKRLYILGDEHMDQFADSLACFMNTGAPAAPQ